TDISFGIYLKPVNKVAEYPVLLELLDNLGLPYESFPETDTFLLFNEENKLQESVALFEEKETSFGTFHLYYNEDGHLELSYSEGESMILTFEDMGLMIFDEEKGCVASKTFNLSKQEQKLLESK
ncbi:MAG: hypothetical protein IKW28_07440, partial [Lachnospiraceae bacterium]|nr:hypothetical protein [Lachnospiraceae bacterium]